MTSEQRKRRAKTMRAPVDPNTLARFSRSARLGARAVGIEPKLIRIALDRGVE